MKTPLIALLLVSSAFAATDPTLFTAAKALFDERKFADAETAFKKLVAADAANAEAQLYYGLAISRRGDFSAAAEAIAQAVKLAPNNARYHFNLGDVYGQAAQKAGILSQYGLAKKCLAGFQRAAELEPANADYHSALFEFYRQAPGLVGGGVDKAEAEAAKLVQLDALRGHTAYAQLYAGDKQFDKALSHAAEIKKLDAARGRLTFANLYVEMKQVDKAFAEFDEALKDAPDNYSVLYQIGRLAAITGQNVDRGLASLRRCLELAPTKDQPSLAAAQWRIGNLLEKKNDLAGARAAYQAALKLDPKFTNAADALKKLK